MGHVAARGSLHGARCTDFAACGCCPSAGNRYSRGCRSMKKRRMPESMRRCRTSFRDYIHGVAVSVERMPSTHTGVFVVRRVWPLPVQSSNTLPEPSFMRQ